MPLKSFPRLEQATPEQRDNFELSPFGIHWEDIDEYKFHGFFRYFSTSFLHISMAFPSGFERYFSRVCVHFYSKVVTFSWPSFHHKNNSFKYLVLPQFQNGNPKVHTAPTPKASSKGVPGTFGEESFGQGIPSGRDSPGDSFGLAWGGVLRTSESVY